MLLVFSKHSAGRSPEKVLKNAGTLTLVSTLIWASIELQSFQTTSLNSIQMLETACSKSIIDSSLDLNHGESLSHSKATFFLIFFNIKRWFNFSLSQSLFVMFWWLSFSCNFDLESVSSTDYEEPLRHYEPEDLNLNVEFKFFS